MLSYVPLFAAFAGMAAAQQTTSFPMETGTRSLFLPFLTAEGTPMASIAGNHSDTTTYVIACPTKGDCNFAPNITVTEGPSSVRYVSTVSHDSTKKATASAILSCELTGTTSAVCGNVGRNGGAVQKDDEKTLTGSDISYRAVHVTATHSTKNGTVTTTVTSLPSSSSSSSSSTSPSTDGAVITAAPWAMGGVMGAGMMALAAL